MSMIKEKNNFNNFILKNVLGIDYKPNYQEQMLYFKI